MKIKSEKGMSMKYLSDFTNCLPIFSNIDFETSQSNLQKNMKQKSFYRSQQYSLQKGETIRADFSNENHRRSYFWDCNFIESNLSNMGMSGSMFKNVTFTDCIINNTKLDSCDFEDCTLQTSSQNNINKLYNLNMSKSTLLNSNFINCEMIGANFTDTVFIDSTFTNCIWQSLALENCIFKNTLLDSVILKKLNFEYAHFDNIKMHNIRLPFPTIPYIFNGLNYLMNTKDKVFISSANSKTGKIGIEEYLSYLHDLEVFYITTQNYFPLSNIYIAQEQWEKAYSSIIMGIKNSMQFHSYRMVYYFCKLLHMNHNFSDKQRSETYDFITQCVSSNGFHLQDQFNIKKYIEPIRNLLLNEKESASLTLNVLTNIEDNDYEKLSLFLKTADNIVKHIIKKTNSPKLKYYVEVRHYCPFAAFFKFFGDPEALMVLAGSLYMAFTGVEFIYNKAMKSYNTYLDAKLKKEQIKNYQLDTQLKELELKSKNKKDDNIDKKEDTSKIYIFEQNQVLKDNNITIVNGNHNLVDNYYKSHDKDFYYFNY